MKPNMTTKEPGSNIMDSISSMLVNALGFSSGVVEFAPRNPPPLVPRCLMLTSEAMGPHGDVLGLALDGLYGDVG